MSEVFDVSLKGGPRHIFIIVVGGIDVFVMF